MPRTKINYSILGAAVSYGGTGSGGMFTLQDEHVGLSSGNFPFGPLNGIPINYLLHGGGGGGGGGINFSPGGAAGIARQGNISIVPGTVNTITVGAGGATSANGGASFFTTVSYGNLIATTGGGVAGSATSGGSNADYQGYAGGAGGAGGGAGAGASAGIAGGRASNNQGGNGYTWWADNTIRGGGGGGGTGGPGSGGSGGGGPGFPNVGTPGTPGTVNTGSGGGGSNDTSGGSTGGSGVVIIRYASSFANITSIGVGLTYSWVSSGGYKTYTFTAGTGSVTW